MPLDRSDDAGRPAADVQSLAQGLGIARGRVEFPCTVQDEFCLRGYSGGTRTEGASNAIR